MMGIFRFIFKLIFAVSAIFIALILMVVMVGISGRKAEESVTSSKADSIVSASQGQGLDWNYHEFNDKMGGKVKYAYIQSLNQVDFRFPYSGSQNAELSLRIHPRYGKDVILKMQKGQFLCHVNNCQVNVRFDDGKIKTYSASEPEDHSTETIFIDNYKGFVANLMKAKKLYIEATFYQEGARVFEFDVAGLKW